MRAPQGLGGHVHKRRSPATACPPSRSIHRAPAGPWRAAWRSAAPGEAPAHQLVARADPLKATASRGAAQKPRKAPSDPWALAPVSEELLEAHRLHQAAHRCTRSRLRSLRSGLGRGMC